MKKIIPALALLLISAMVLASASYAWFSMNRTVTATGMKVTATAEGSLVITTGSAPAANENRITVAMPDTSATALLATTHDDTYGTYPNGLKYNTNPEVVDATTGLQQGSSGLVFSSAVNAGQKNYYKDYVVYIAASGVALEGYKLTVTIDNPAVLDTLPAATSIDFYVAENSVPTVSDSTFKGTLNLAGLDPVTNDATTEKTALEITPLNIPVANGSAAIVVLMRVYIDGALKDSSATTFIKTVDAAEIADKTIDVKFVASKNP